MYHGFYNRGQKILSLLPKVGADSEAESDGQSEAGDDIILPSLDKPEEIEDELLEKHIEDFFEVLDFEDPDVLDVSSVMTEKRTIEQPGPSTSTSPKKMPRKRSRVQLKGTQSVKKKKKVLKRKLLNSKWTDEEFRGAVTIPNDEMAIVPAREPIEYFKTFFSDEVFDLIVYNTNLYAVQKTGKSVQITKEQIYEFIAIELKMGITNMPAYTDFWAIETRYDKVADIMALKKYELIRRSLHFCNNEEVDTSDRYYKIRKFLEIIRKNCCNYENLRRQSIDEMMIPYKGNKAGNRKQYLKSKPKKWGYKVFVRASVDGFVHDFLFYDGADTFRSIKFSKFEELFTMAPKVILALCKTIPNTALSVVYFDNFFTTLPLVNYLRHEYGILSLGTIRENRLGEINLISEKNLKKKGRGSYEEKSDNENKLVVVKWLDNKPVTFASSFVGANPVESKKRWSKVKKQKIDVECPQVVLQYNQHMGGVDLADMLVALYRTEYKTHKWYMSIFSQMLDICVNNAWLSYRRHVPKEKMIPLKKFRISVANSLISSSRSRPVGRPRSAGKSTSHSPSFSRKSTPSPLPVQIQKFDEKGHFPNFGARGRCRQCHTGQTNVYCIRCDVRLCFTFGRNCFLDFHKKTPNEY